MRSSLVEDAIPVVHQVVASMRRRLPRSVDRDELIAAGMLGLAQAAQAYDPTRGVSFTAYARTRVTGAVLDELRSLDTASRRLRSRSRAIEASAAALSAELGRTATDDELSRRAGVTVADLRAVRNSAARAAAVRQSTGGADDVVAGRPTPEAGPEDLLLDAELHGYVADAVAALPERLRAVVVGYVCEGRPMKELALELDVTESRVSQLCTEAITLMRDAIKAQLDAETTDEAPVKGRAERRKAAYYNAVAEASTVAQRLERRIETAA